MLSVDLRFADLSDRALASCRLNLDGLQWACLCGADLSRCELKEEMVDFASYDARTVWPPGFVPSYKAILRSPISAKAIASLGPYAREAGWTLGWREHYDANLLDMAWTTRTRHHRLLIAGRENVTIVLHERPRWLRLVPYDRAWKSLASLKDGFDWETLKACLEGAKTLAEAGLP